VVIVLDNSGSQNQTDSTKVRRAVSLDFVTRFNQLVSRKPDTKVHLPSVVCRYGDAIQLGPPRWQRRPSVWQRTDRYPAQCDRIGNQQSQRRD